MSIFNIRNQYKHSQSTIERLAAAGRKGRDYLPLLPGTGVGVQSTHHREAYYVNKNISWITAERPELDNHTLIYV